VKSFTGIDDIYEEPENPEIILETDKMGIAEAVNKILDYLQQRRHI